MKAICELCGDMVGYAVNQHTKCSVGETQLLQDFEHAYAIIPDDFSDLELSMAFCRRNVRSYGINFNFCTVSEKTYNLHKIRNGCII